MKKTTDPRHRHRQKLIKNLFAYSFQPQTSAPENINSIIDNLPQIDQIISQNAPEWPISQINKADLAILRLSVYELTHTKTPQKVVIDEAVELGKEFGSNSSAKFINGVLGNLLKQKDDSLHSSKQPSK